MSVWWKRGRKPYPIKWSSSTSLSVSTLRSSTWSSFSTTWFWHNLMTVNRGKRIRWVWPFRQTRKKLKRCGRSSATVWLSRRLVRCWQSSSISSAPWQLSRFYKRLTTKVSSWGGSTLKSCFKALMKGWRTSSMRSGHSGYRSRAKRLEVGSKKFSKGVTLTNSY